MGNAFLKKLFIFEMANNHGGDVEHGIEIIQQIKKACEGLDFQVAFKFQYRDLDTFIHPDFKGRDDIKYVKRFSETRLDEMDFLTLKKEAEKQGFITVCTPFDEASVHKIKEHDYSIVKIASCSFTDWSLLEEIAKLDKPIIASTASAALDEIDKVISFFENRKKELCIMHCVGAYPTLQENLQLNQIDLLKKRYPELTVGFSTHEEPSNINSIKVAVGKGAQVFERHVAIESDKYPINGYSSTPEQIKNWLLSAQEAYQICGTEEGRYAITEKEKTDLCGLRRGVFAKIDLVKGQKLKSDNIFYAIPCAAEQVVANDISKYIEYTLEKDLKANEPVNFVDVSIKNLREKVLSIITQLKEIIIKSHIALPNRIELELSHHYGIEKYHEWGAAILNCINREYCKKLIILLPGQKHPFHHHVKKEETFQVLYGEMNVAMNDAEMLMQPGEMLTVERGARHNFSSENGCIFEEVSTTHYKNDSFYEDKDMANNLDRKTQMTFWSDWLYKTIK